MITIMASMHTMRVIWGAKCVNVIVRKKLSLNSYGELGVFKNGGLRTLRMTKNS